LSKAAAHLQISPKTLRLAAECGEIDGSRKTLQQIDGGLIEPVYQGLDDNHL